MIEVTAHAVERYIERVEACSWDTAKARILEAANAVETAAAIGCRSVRLGCGARLFLDGNKVVTVYPRGAVPVSVWQGRKE